MCHKPLTEELSLGLLTRFTQPHARWRCTIRLFHHSSDLNAAHLRMFARPTVPVSVSRSRCVINPAYVWRPPYHSSSVTPVWVVCRKLQLRVTCSIKKYTVQLKVNSTFCHSSAFICFWKDTRGGESRGGAVIWFRQRWRWWAPPPPCLVWWGHLAVVCLFLRLQLLLSELWRIITESLRPLYLCDSPPTCYWRPPTPLPPPPPPPWASDEGTSLLWLS